MLFINNAYVRRKNAKFAVILPIFPSYYINILGNTLNCSSSLSFPLILLFIMFAVHVVSMHECDLISSFSAYLHPLETFVK